MKKLYRCEITLVLALALLLTGCGDNKEAEAKALKLSIDKLRTDACKSWASGIVSGSDATVGDTVYISEVAAKKFYKLAAADVSYEYARKAANTLTVFNGKRVADNLKSMLLTALIELKSVCVE